MFSSQSSLFFLYSFKLLFIRAHFLYGNVFLVCFVLFYFVAVDVIRKTFRWDEGLAASIFFFVERSFWKWNFPALQDWYL